jgi:hypothetical protein
MLVTVDEKPVTYFMVVSLLVFDGEIGKCFQLKMSLKLDGGGGGCRENSSALMK